MPHCSRTRGESRQWYQNSSLTYQIEVECIFQTDCCFRCARSMHFQMPPESDWNPVFSAQSCSNSWLPPSCQKKHFSMTSGMEIYRFSRRGGQWRRVSLSVAGEQGFQLFTNPCFFWKLVVAIFFSLFPGCGEKGVRCTFLNVPVLYFKLAAPETIISYENCLKS